MNKKIIKLYLLFVTALSLILLGYLFFKNYIPSGRLEISCDFSSKSRFIKQFTPATRTKTICNQHKCQQKIFDDPIYLDVIVPKKFDFVTVKLVVENNHGKVINIGKKIGPEWDYEIKKTFVEDNIHFASFDLLNLYTEKKQTTFIISIPEIHNNDDELLINEISLIFEKTTWWQKLKNRL